MTTEETQKVLCPYCGAIMLQHGNGYGAWWYECNGCGATTAIVGNEKLAKMVALDYHNRADTDEICKLKDTVENLTLYLKEAFELCPDDLEVLNDWHPGLPGYAPNISNN